MTQLPMLNLGCGRVILPAARPAHYGLIDPITEYALWHNVDRNAEPGVDEVVDIFRYPFPWADNSFDGALCAHICEHIPHEIRPSEDVYTDPSSDPERMALIERAMAPGLSTYERLDLLREADARQRRPKELTTRAVELSQLQDGWYAFFAELHRVCTPGSIIHVLSPYAWSQGGVTDPTHTRLLTEHTFTHSMQPDPNSPFKYATGGLNLGLVEPARFAFTSLAEPYMHDPAMLQRAMQTQLNMCYELYVKLRVVK